MKWKWFKARYIIAALVIITSIVVTPHCFQKAREYRICVGVNTYVIGGEYFVIPFGVIGAWSVIFFAGSLDNWKILKRERMGMEDVVGYSIGNIEN